MLHALAISSVERVTPQRSRTSPPLLGGYHPAILLAMIIGVSLWMIHDLDRPFDGINRIEPPELARTQLFVEADFAQRFVGVSLPCDGQGTAAAP